MDLHSHAPEWDPPRDDDDLLMDGSPRTLRVTLDHSAGRDLNISHAAPPANGGR